jgi:hypothetical protein
MPKDTQAGLRSIADEWLHRSETSRCGYRGAALASASPDTGSADANRQNELAGPHRPLPNKLVHAPRQHRNLNSLWRAALSYVPRFLPLGACDAGPGACGTTFTRPHPKTFT